MLRRDFVSGFLYGSSAWSVQNALTTACKSHQSNRRELSALSIGAIVVGGRDTFGAQLGIEEAQHASTMLHTSVDLFTEVASGTRGTSSTAIDRMLAAHSLSAIIGGGDSDSCTEIAQSCAAHGLLYINTTSRSDSLRRTRCMPGTFHAIPSEQMAVDALAVAGANQTATAVAWDASLRRYGADTLNTRYRTRFDQPMNERAWADWFAIKVLWETFLRVHSASPAALIAALAASGAHFDGHKGRPLSFREWDHQLRQPMYITSGAASEYATVIEVPASADESESSIAALDKLGAPSGATSCDTNP